MSRNRDYEFLLQILAHRTSLAPPTVKLLARKLPATAGITLAIISTHVPHKPAVADTAKLISGGNYKRHGQC